jgi:hypothetical protein
VFQLSAEYIANNKFSQIVTLDNTDVFGIHYTYYDAFQFHPVYNLIKVSSFLPGVAFSMTSSISALFFIIFLEPTFMTTLVPSSVIPPHTPTCPDRLYIKKIS